MEHSRLESGDRLKWGGRREERAPQTQLDRHMSCYLGPSTEMNYDQGIAFSNNLCQDSKSKALHPARRRGLRPRNRRQTILSEPIFLVCIRSGTVPFTRRRQSSEIVLECSMHMCLASAPVGCSNTALTSPKVKLVTSEVKNNQQNPFQKCDASAECKSQSSLGHCLLQVAATARDGERIQEDRAV